MAIMGPIGFKESSTGILDPKQAITLDTLGGPGRLELPRACAIALPDCEFLCSGTPRIAIAGSVHLNVYAPPTQQQVDAQPATGPSICTGTWAQTNCPNLRAVT